MAARASGCSVEACLRMMPVVIGREGELALLELLLSRAAQQRRAALATIVGPPGIGNARAVPGARRFVRRAT